MSFLFIPTPPTHTLTHDVSLQIDPTRVRDWEASANRKRLLQHTENIWNAVVFSLAHCPGEFKAVFHQLQAMAAAKYSDDETAKYTVVSAAFFLRFVCPAILNPKLFDLLSAHPEDHAKRTLTLIAKILQNLANLAPFGQKEPFMVDCNPFIDANIAVMKSFIDNISVCLLPPPPPSLNFPTCLSYGSSHAHMQRVGVEDGEGTPLKGLVLGRELALMHRTVDSLYPEIEAYNEANPVCNSRTRTSHDRHANSSPYAFSDSSRRASLSCWHVWTI